MIHDPLADGRFTLRHARSARSDHAARLVPGDERLGPLPEPERLLRLARRRAVELEIRAAQPGGLHLDHDFARTGRRIWEVAHLDTAIAEEHRALHFRSSGANSRGRRSGISGQMMMAASISSMGTSMINVSFN